MKCLLKKIKLFIKDCYNIFLLFKSNLFDAKYYRLEMPNYRGNLLIHYYKIGYLEGKNPSEKFDNDYYLEKYKDVRDANINPLVHYLKIGKKEKRKIKGFKGLSIQKIIRREYKDFFFYNIHFVCFNDKVNIFVENLDKLSFNYLNSLKDRYKKDLIVYYKNKSNNCKFISNIKYIKIDKYYYINIKNNDVVICYDFVSFLSISKYNLKNVILDFIERDDSNESEKNFIKYLFRIRRKDCLIKSLNENLEQYNIFNVEKTKDIIFDIQNNFSLSLYLISELFLNNKFNDEINVLYLSNDYKIDIVLDNGLIIYSNCKDKYKKIVLFDCKMDIDK